MGTQINSAHGPAVAATADEQLRAAEISDPLRQFAFRFSLVLIFLRFSLAQFILTYLTDRNLYLLYFFGLPALIGVVLNGGIRRTFESRAAWFWAGYALWLIVALPFSVWRGGSIPIIWGFLRADFPTLLVIGGLGMTWRECRAVLHTIGWAAVVSTLAGPIFDKDVGPDRVGLAFGTVADPNDYSAHLLLVLPFLLWVVFSSKSTVLRALALCGLGGGMLVIVRTASRGAAVAIFVAMLFFLFRATSRQRIAMLLILPIGGLVILAASPHAALDRMMSVAARSSGDWAVETDESAMSRFYLLKKSIEYTLKFPLFGVGAGQFQLYEGENNAIIGTHGMWHESHNTYTQASSECGIPALIFMLGGLVCSWLSLSAVHRKARERIDCQDIQSAAFCALLSMVGFCTAATFLNFAYSMYLPAISGIAIVLARCASHEMQVRAAAGPPLPVAFAPWAMPAPARRRAVKTGLPDRQAKTL